MKARSTMMLAVSVGLAVVVVQSAPATAARKRVCDAHRRGALRVTRSVVVYGIKRPDRAYEGPLDTVYYACLRPGGASVEVGIQGPDLFPFRSDYTTTDLQIAGTYVAAQSSSGKDATDACTKTGDSRTCPSPTYWVSVVDTKSRRHVDIARRPPDSDIGDAAATSLSAQGAVAWIDLQSPPDVYVLEATALPPLGRSSFTPTLAAIDTGVIDPGSLRFIGRTLKWVRDGQPHEQTLT